jgi:hypothetical protein
MKKPVVKLFFTLKNDTMNTNQKDPNCCTTGGDCCGGLGDLGCC